MQELNSYDIASIMPESASRIKKALSTKTRPIEVTAVGPELRHAAVGHFDGIILPENLAMLREWSERQRTDDLVSEAILRINSPGGLVEGVPETFEFLRRLAKTKTLTVLAEGYCCSAAYWIASAATRLYASPSCYVGSCGVISLLVDDSAAFAMQGVRIIPVSTADAKSEGTPGQQITEADIARVQRRIVDTKNSFVKDLRRSGRMNADQRENAFESGEAFKASTALQRGMIDKVTIPEDYLDKTFAEIRKENYLDLTGEAAEQKFRSLVCKNAGAADFWETSDSDETKIRQQYPELAASYDRAQKSYRN